MKRVIPFALALVISLTLVYEVTACGGTPRPPTCNRSIWLAKSVPQVVVRQANGSAQIRAVLLPYYTQSGPQCGPMPNGTLSITINCFVVGQPGGPVQIGPINVPLQNPMVQGNQQLATGGNLWTFNAPAGTFQPNTWYNCQIVGVFTAANLQARGDASVCVVPPSPLDTTIPMLDARYLTPNNEEFRSCRKGDQASMYYLVSNNHPTRSVTLDLTSLGRQTAVLPEGLTEQNAYDSGAYAISHPVPGTDVFPAGFGDTLTPGALLREGDAMQVNPYRLQRTLTLGPCQARIIPIVMRSYGMCADGSCNERDMIFRGRWDNGDSAIACASTLLRVDSLAPKSPLCEYLDEIKVSDSSAGRFSPGIFLGQTGPIQNAITHFAGNLPPLQNPAVELNGAGLNDPLFPFPPYGNDYIRMNSLPVGVRFNALVFSHLIDFFPFQNNVQVVNLNAQPMVEIPFLVGQPSMELFDIRYDAGTDSVSVLDANQRSVYNGLLAQLIANPPSGIQIDLGTCRRLTKSGSLNDLAIGAVPPIISRLFTRSATITARDSTRIVRSRTGVPIDWHGTIVGTGSSLPDTTGTGTLRIGYDIWNLPPCPQTTINWIQVSSPGAINNPVQIPVAIRVNEFDTMAIEQVDYTAPFVQPNSSQGAVTLTYPSQRDLRFVNMLGRRAGDTTASWIIRNLPLPPFPRQQMVTYWFDMGPLGIRDGSDVGELEVAVTVSDTVQRMQPSLQSWQSRPVGALEYNVPSGAIADSILPLLPIVPIPYDIILGVTQIDYEYHGCTIPNIDLDNSRHAAGSTAGYAGDNSACAPAAAANSLQWLERTNPNLDSTSGHRQKMEELSRLMGRNNAGDQANTKALVQGKLAYIDKYKLPIHVKFQGYGYPAGTNIASPDTTYGHSATNHNAAESNVPSWDWFFKEVQAGEDVEIKFGRYDAAGNRTSGHWITAAGAITINDTIRGFWVKEDTKQSDTGGTRMDYVEWDSVSAGYVVMRGLEGETRQIRIEGVVSESYDANVTFEPVGSVPQGETAPVLSLAVVKNPTVRGEPVVIEFGVDRGTEISVDIYDLRGREIVRLAAGRYEAGRHAIQWNGLDAGAAFVPTGTYFVMLRVGEAEQVVRVVRE